MTLGIKAGPFWSTNKLFPTWTYVSGTAVGDFPRRRPNLTERF